MKPDGNVIEFTQLGEKWYQHLENRRKNEAPTAPF
jgi:uncharacterized ferritin-like protein (DUF455 family)